MGADFPLGRIRDFDNNIGLGTQLARFPHDWIISLCASHLALVVRFRLDLVQDI